MSNKQEIAKQAREAAIAVNADKIVVSLDQLSVKCAEWENGIYKTATEGLHALLAECLDIYNRQFLKAGDDVKVAFRKELAKRLAAEGIRVVKTTLTMHLLVRYIFKSDRRRAHVYAYVLRAAVQDGIDGLGLSDYIRAAGGVEEIRRKQVLSDEALKKREEVATAVNDVAAEIERNSAQPLGTITAPVGEDYKEFCVVLGKPQGDGTIALVSVLADVSEVMVRQFNEKLAKVRLAQGEAKAQAASEATGMQAPLPKAA